MVEMTLWAIQAHILTANGSVHLPTFYLDAQVQGILTESHACKVARDIIMPKGFNPYGYPVNVSAMAIHYNVVPNA